MAKRTKSQIGFMRWIESSPVNACESIKIFSNVATISVFDLMRDVEENPVCYSGFASTYPAEAVKGVIRECREAIRDGIKTGFERAANCVAFDVTFRHSGFDSRGNVIYQGGTVEPIGGRLSDIDRACKVIARLNSLSNSKIVTPADLLEALKKAGAVELKQSRFGTCLDHLVPYVEA